MRENKNFAFVKDGEEYWFSRSLACGLICFAYNENHELHVLVNKRGKGCKFNVGKWNIPGGFIDFGENAETCACREAYEETGVIVDPKDIKFLDLNTEPVGERQTMTARFYYLFNDLVENIKTTNEYSESDEVEEIKWLKCETDEDRNEMSKMNWSRDQYRYILIAILKLRNDMIISNSI